MKKKPISLIDFIGWLELRDPGERYDYQDSKKCIAGQYLAERGIPSRDYTTCGPALGEKYFPEIYPISCGDYKRTSWTVGAALDRACCLLPSQQGGSKS